MAIINNLSASITSFQKNGDNSNFQDCGGTYNTSNILNGGETYDEGAQILSYGFKISGLQGHIIKSIIVNSLLLTDKGELCQTTKFRQILDGILINSDIVGNTTTKVISNTEFNIGKEINDQYEFIYELQNTSNRSCYYCIESIVINLSDIKYRIHISFSGQQTKRKPSSIQVISTLQNLESVPITFSKDSTRDYDIDIDSIEGRAYFRKDGIYVDGYQYGTVAPSTDKKFGIVKLSKDRFDTFIDEDGNEGIQAPIENGIAASTQLVYNITEDIQNGIISPPIATDKIKGVVILRNKFEIDKDGEIVAPIEDGVAASDKLLFNAIASIKQYTHNLIEGMQAPIDIETSQIVDIIDEDSGEVIGQKYNRESLKEGFTFSQDFEKDSENKIYISWLEITK